jgi:hypothetical protein
MCLGMDGKTQSSNEYRVFSIDGSSKAMAEAQTITEKTSMEKLRVFRLALMSARRSLCIANGQSVSV